MKLTFLGTGTSTGVPMIACDCAVCSSTDPHNRRRRTSVYVEAAATKGKPTCIVANTIKGKGVSFMENNPKWHGVAPSPEEAAIALKELA